MPVTDPLHFVAAQNQLTLLRFAYDELEVILRRRAFVSDAIGGMPVNGDPRRSAIASELCTTTIPAIRSRLGMPPDENLAEIANIFR